VYCLLWKAELTFNPNSGYPKFELWVSTNNYGYQNIVFWISRIGYFDIYKCNYGYPQLRLNAPICGYAYKQHLWIPKLPFVPFCGYPNTNYGYPQMDCRVNRFVDIKNAICGHPKFYLLISINNCGYPKINFAYPQMYFGYP
jgi:hypothetical protein